MTTQTQHTQQNLLTPADVAETIGVPVRTIRAWVRRGLVDSVRIGIGGQRIGLDPSVIDQLRYEV
jgi:predicted site-specific integrase-resolvase